VRFVVKNSQKLRNLSFGGYWVTDTKISILARQAVKLESLDLCDADITRDSIDILIQYRLETLKRITVNNCELDDLSDVVERHPNLLLQVDEPREEPDSDNELTKAEHKLQDGEYNKEIEKLWKDVKDE
jgi:hypothetical protein